jgi:hypothetical protein
LSRPIEIAMSEESPGQSDQRRYGLRIDLEGVAKAG